MPLEKLRIVDDSFVLYVLVRNGRHACGVFSPLFFQELEVVTSVREALTNALSDAREQQRQNKEMKHQLEFDWSDKVFVFDKKIKLFGEL